MFTDNSKPIYLQIADRISDQILAGEFADGDRLPSVREYAAKVQVNPNTVMRTYDSLAADAIIFNRRGIGYFVADGAARAIRSLRASQFLRDELPDLFRRLNLLGLKPDELANLYSNYLSDNAQQ
ncbi:MAG: GntR family transcriptional regulator [Muribaculaceae bacterium]|nr:GntR family transcriptional regulator [Muribaculaceae bacterium]